MTRAANARDIESVLVLAPNGRDARLTCELLARENIDALPCDNVAELEARLELGGAAALIAEEALNASAIASLHRVLAHQPVWSDFPFVVFGDHASNHAHLDRLGALGNLTVLDRPVKVRTMVAAVVAAVRARRRQYEARREIEARDQFLAMLGHELRNPLSAVTLAVQLLEKSDSASAQEKARKIIGRQTRHLALLVDDLLDVARITYGKVTLHRVEIDLAEVVRACFQTHEALAREGGLGFSMKSDVEGPVLVSGDRVRLDQILTNLIGNAIKYTPRGGSVRVELERDASQVIVSVRDTGIGIAEAMLPHVFELFQQADRTLDRAQGGLGLGLTVVRGLTRLHGGDVEASSDGLGRGSVFRVILPLLAEHAEAAATPVVEEKTRPSPRRVVLVEDNDDIRVGLASLLSAAGHQVVTASDGPGGLERILAIKPHVAFVDIGLPLLDGFEVARRVRSAGDLAVRLVAVTGYGQLDDRRRATEAGFDAHLTKPVRIEEIERALAEAG